MLWFLHLWWCLIPVGRLLCVNICGRLLWGWRYVSQSVAIQWLDPLRLVWKAWRWKGQGFCIAALWSDECKSLIPGRWHIPVHIPWPILLVLARSSVGAILWWFCLVPGDLQLDGYDEYPWGVALNRCWGNDCFFCISSICEVSVGISDIACMIFLLPLFHEQVIAVLALLNEHGRGVGL